MTESHKTNQAENSLESLQHAVDQAESHPSDEKIEEAENSLAHAEIAVRQADKSGGSGADNLARQLNEEEAALGGTQE